MGLGCPNAAAGHRCRAMRQIGMTAMPKPHILHRAPSHEVQCLRYDDASDTWCAAPLQFVVTRSPLSNERWHELVVQRCLAGHIHAVQGVEPELNVLADDNPDDGDQAYGV